MKSEVPQVISIDREKELAEIQKNQAPSELIIE
jgi:hypothetical protein